MNATPHPPSADVPDDESGGASVRLRAWYGSLSKGVRTAVAVIVGAGAVATAIGAILALLPNPTPELGAVLSKVSVEPGVTLDEFAASHEFASTSLEPPTARLIVLVAPTTGVPTNAAPVAPATGVGTTTTETTTEGETTTTDTTTTTTTGETTPGTTTNEEGELRPVIPEETRLEIDEGVREALETAAVPPRTLGKVCTADLTSPDCGLPRTYMLNVGEDGSPQKVKAKTVASRLGKLLDGTRVDSGRELVGATVNFNITLTGFSGRTVVVRWSLHRAKGGSRLPNAWLRNQSALWIVGEAQKDSASADFWVPLPKVKGPFFVRLGVYDEGDGRLDYHDTKPPIG